MAGDNLELIPATSSILNEKSSEVSPAEIASKKLQLLIDGMIRLSEGKGKGSDSRQMVGLAAVQVGVPLRVITLDMTADGSNKPQSLLPIINPELSDLSDKMTDGREGCWSCGSICGNVPRHLSVTLNGYDRSGEPIEKQLDGFLARIAQHEVDHLNGIRFPDRIPVDEPWRLHTVQPEEFERYRSDWANWHTLCPLSEWEALKQGK